MPACAIRWALRAPLLVLLCLAPSAHAAWPHDPYTNVLACGATGNQLEPLTVPDGAGGVILVWVDPRAATDDIYAQRISAAGVPLWGANGLAICTEATAAQLDPSIIPDGSGGAVISWTDLRNNATSQVDLYAQRVNAAGSVLWTANGVPVCTATADQLLSRLVADGTGGAIVVWYDLRSGAGDIYAQKLTSAGTRSWLATGVALCTAANAQGQGSLRAVTDGAGGAIAAWDDLRVSPANLYAQRVLSSGAVSWTVNGVVVCDEVQTQLDLELVPDGAGGAIAAWQDYRNGVDANVYALRLNPSGLGLWGSDGVLVCGATGEQFGLGLTSDGLGGAIIAWEDQRSGASDIYAQRIGGGGTALWTANGVALCNSVNGQITLSLTGDGSGGVIAAWVDFRAGGLTYEIYAQRMSGTGVAQWTLNGALVCGAVSQRYLPSVSSDGVGGAIVAWRDFRNLTHFDICAQRIERFGQLGNPEPVITGVKDVKNDQGGFVKVSWNASWLDVDPVYGVFDYRLWRSVPASLVTRTALSRGFSSDPDESAASGRWLVLPSAVTDYAWELVGTQAAAILGAYSLVAATTADSIPGSFPKTAFMVEARANTALNADRWYSAPDSGYSVDNLAPAAPAPLTGQYAAGSTALHWNRNTEADLAGYRLYRGSSAGFVPSPANLVDALADTGYVDAAGAPFVYKLTAIDVHGNESPVATLIPAGALDVPGGPLLSRAFLELASENPSRGGTAFRFGLVGPGRVTFAVYDAGGRRMRVLVSGAFEAGEHPVAWDGRDEAGRPVAAGLYFARIEGPGLSATRRIARTN